MSTIGTDRINALADQVAERERRVEDLRGFELEYRYALRANLTSLLEDLNGRETGEWPRKEMIGPEWSVIAPGLEVRATGNGLVGRVVIEVRDAVTP